MCGLVSLSKGQVKWESSVTYQLSHSLSQPGEAALGPEMADILAALSILRIPSGPYIHCVTGLASLDSYQEGLGRHHKAASPSKPHAYSFISHLSA